MNKYICDLSSTDNAFVKHENKWYRFFDGFMSPLTENSVVVSVSYVQTQDFESIDEQMNTCFVMYMQHHMWGYKTENIAWGPREIELLSCDV